MFQILYSFLVTQVTTNHVFGLFFQFSLKYWSVSNRVFTLKKRKILQKIKVMPKKTPNQIETHLSSQFDHEANKDTCLNQK